MIVEKANAKLSSRTRRRRGVNTLEVILVLFILLVATFAVFQFGVAILIKQAVAHSATVAAREAGKGADVAELAAVVDEILDVHNLVVGPTMSVVLEDNLAVMPVDQEGTLACTPPALPALNNDEVRVTVCVALDQTPFLNILSPYGIDFTGKTFTVSSMVKKEL